MQPKIETAPVDSSEIARPREDFDEFISSLGTR